MFTNFNLCGNAIASVLSVATPCGDGFIGLSLHLDIRLTSPDSNDKPMKQNVVINPEKATLQLPQSRTDHFLPSIIDGRDDKGQPPDHYDCDIGYGKSGSHHTVVILLVLMIHR